MTKVLLSIHVLAAIIAIGPVTVAASMFPAAARRALAATDAGSGSAVVHTLHRVCRVYAVVGIVVPVFGLATASSLGVLGDAWLIVSMVLTAAAAAVLGLLVIPRQSAILTDLGTPAGSTTEAIAETRRRALARLAMHTGIFNVLWAVVTVLMIVRPGSTTGV
ncbi:DUF2269 family protein [Saccharopolyspora erythraea]|uniref:DUF2269 family protein n=1 Tax=Saccharopolyspora erythraea TaxID=1836 RepID=UPI001BA4E026|nr:DUF2269 family protein [Saccharopolyspora erythraea]QUH02381.1 DUF2269 family protein [Saccharopolyspora erythraea]